MTIDEAINILKQYVDYDNPDVPDFYTMEETIKVIIKALEQEPCEDCISRQAVLEVIDFYDGQNQQHFTVDNLRDDIENIPPITPAEKVGHWVMPVQDDGMSGPIHYQVRCSECGFDLDPQTWHQELYQFGADKYCPKCGAKMQEVEE